MQKIFAAFCAALFCASIAAAQTETQNSVPPPNQVLNIRLQDNQPILQGAHISLLRTAWPPEQDSPSLTAQASEWKVKIWLSPTTRVERGQIQDSLPAGLSKEISKWLGTAAAEWWGSHRLSYYQLQPPSGHKANEALWQENLVCLMCPAGTVRSRTTGAEPFETGGVLGDRDAWKAKRPPRAEDRLILLKKISLVDAAGSHELATFLVDFITTPQGVEINIYQVRWLMEQAAAK